MFDTKQARFERLVRAYSGELFRYGYWLSRDRFIAEDLVQETFARAWSAWASLRDEAASKAWLYTILRNENARRFERKQLEVADGIDLDTIEDQKLRSISAELDMRDALHELPEGYREPLLMQVVAGFTCEEIAQVMGLTTGAVMTRLSRARLALRHGAARTDHRKESR